MGAVTDKQRLARLLKAEATLKKTTRGYSPRGIYWRTGMPLLWAVRMDLGSTDNGLALAKAHGLLKQTTQGYSPRAARWAEAMDLIDAVEEDLRPMPVPGLGPVVAGGKSVLLESPTHNTDGLFGNPRCPDPSSHWPAFDFGWVAGKEVLAVEAMQVIQQSSAMGADAFYARGESGLLYWYGHIVKAPPTGHVLRQGARVSTIAAIPGADHGHLGIDARVLVGRDLLWGRRGNGPDYTYGAPSIGVQLARYLV